MTMTPSSQSLTSFCPGLPLQGEISVPGDKSISHRAAILAGLANGVSRISGFLKSEDCLNTLYAMRQLGAKIEFLPNGDIEIEGVGGNPKQPEKPIDCGNSGTGMRLMAGMLAAYPIHCEMFGDESLSSRPMGRIIEPLTAMGADIQALGEKPGCAPLRINGKALHGMNWQMNVASAQVKSCILLAGMATNGKTSLTQPATTRDHTERLFSHFGISCQISQNHMEIQGPQIPQAADLIVPGDISSAAFWIVAAAAKEGSDLTIRRVGLNPTRTAILDVLKRMGADIEILPEGGENGEPYGSIRIRGSKLHSFSLEPAEIPNLIDEIPILSIAAALAEGKSSLRHAKELRVKETDRISTVLTNLAAMGVSADEFDDGLEITGPVQFSGARMQSFGDHRIAMSFLTAGLFASGKTTLENTGCIATSYPEFAGTLTHFLAQESH